MSKLSDQKPHFVLVPLLAQGHMIPMVDMARLLASRGTVVSYITTPVNAARIKPIIDGTKALGLPIQFTEFKFPCSEAGFPEGCESFDLLASWDLTKPFFEATSLLRHPLLLYLQETNPRPSCMITDYCNWWTEEVAQELNIPRFIFHGPCCFFLLSSQNIRQHNVYESVADWYEPVVIPDLPQRIEITRAQAPGWFADWKEVEAKVIKAEATATGIVMNTFHELEPEYIERYIKASEKIVLPIGPLSLYNKDVKSKAIRGNKSSIDEHQLASWLDSMEPRSVLFVNFGSLVRFQPSQLIEIGCGLEASNRPFIWVIKEVEKCAEVEEWMSKGFEDMTRARSLIITGWAPQVVILSHPAVGGFITHCGWNSVLEAVSSGVPMITWPSFGDQFLNERLVVEVLRIGVAVGIKIPFFELKKGEVAVKRDAIDKSIMCLMDSGEEGKDIRERAKDFGEKARKAMEEGGSSYRNLTLLVQFALEHAHL